MKHERIAIDPAVMGGKPVIKGTRVPAEKILRELGNGLTYEAIIAEYPNLKIADIQAVQAFAADYMRDWTAAYDNVDSAKAP